MYVFIVIALMLALPLISIVAQIILTDHGALHGAWYLAAVAKWYVFWAVGVRLSLAGLRQIIQPRYTAETILGLKGAESLFFVRELGFARARTGVCECIDGQRRPGEPGVAVLGDAGRHAGGDLLRHCRHQSLLSPGPQ
jgi:hypothetical protein